jgi:hypothetical protein
MKRVVIASLTVVLALAVALASWNAPSPVPTPGVATTPRVHRYPIDLERRFQFRVLQRQATALPAGDVLASGDLELDGVLSLTGRRTSFDADVVVLRIEALRAAAARVMDQPVPLEGLAGAEAWASLDPSGQLLALHFAEATPTPVRYLLQTLCGDLFVPTPDEPTKQVVEQLAMGDVGTTLTWRGASALNRARTRFVTWRLGQPSPDSLSMHDEADVSFDSTGLLTALTADAELLGTTTNGRTVARRMAVMTLQFLEAHPRPAQVLSAVTHPLLRPVGGVKSEIDQRRALLEAQAAGVTFDDVLQAFTKYEDPREWNDRAEFVLRAVAVLQLFPERAGELVAVFQKARSDQMRAQVLDVLASAGHPQAQAALVDALRTNSTDPLAARQLFQRLALIKAPSTATLQFALDQHAAATASGDRDDRNARAYVLGGLAFNARTSAPQLRATMVDQLIDDVDHATSPKDLQATLRALGNAGDARSLEVARQNVTSPEPLVRAAALTALRRVPGGEVEQLLRHQLTVERSREAQAAAFDALRGRDLSEETALTLRDLVHERQLQPGAERALLKLLNDQRTASPALIQTLQALLLMPGLSATTRAEVQATIARLAS